MEQPCTAGAMKCVRPSRQRAVESSHAPLKPSIACTLSHCPRTQRHVHTLSLPSHSASRAHSLTALALSVTCTLSHCARAASALACLHAHAPTQLIHPPDYLAPLSTPHSTDPHIHHPPTIHASTIHQPSTHPPSRLAPLTTHHTTDPLLKRSTTSATHHPPPNRSIACSTHPPTVAPTHQPTHPPFTYRNFFTAISRPSSSIFS